MVQFDMQVQQVGSQYIAGHDIYLQQMAAALSLTVAEYRRNRSRMLAKVRAFWITGVLEQSLHEVALIALGFCEQPTAIANPSQLVVEESNQPARPLPQGMPITQVYDDAGGELLILGEPGAGKSTLLLQLARDLLDRAEQDESLPMPVVFNLSSWAVKRQLLADWLAEELNSKYQVPHKLAQAWVDSNQILPLLDGLDEVPQEQRAACVTSINTYRREHGIVPTVVCSRSADYYTQSARLILRRAVVAQPLTVQQIDASLSGAGEKLEAIRVALHNDPDLQEMITTPLMLNVLTLAYPGKSTEDLQRAGIPTTRGKICADYIERMLQPRAVNRYYTLQQTKLWLAWLAQQSSQHGQTEFYIERMQFDWSSKRGMLQLTSGLIQGLVGGIAWGLFFGPIGGLVIALIFGLLGALKPTIQPADILAWSWRSVRRSLATILFLWLIVGLFTGLLFALPSGLIKGLLFALPLPSGLIKGLLFGAVFGLIPALTLVLQFGLSGNRLEERDHINPNEGIRRSALNSVIGGLVGGLAGGLSCVLVNTLVGVPGGRLNILAGVVLFALSGWLAYGGYTCIQHIILRLFLWRTGFVPLNYPRFLDYAAERILLRKVGGGYIFVHRLLLEYFASLNATLPSHQARELAQASQPQTCQCGYQDERTGVKFCPHCGQPRTQARADPM